ncbi:MAG: riboflavin synthase [Deltaproteobacteria bacterium]|nr:riboflavin synthase [Deltaproteobacteria bacterium]MBK8237716.1 riboflavin synthase [Deltaproteobacteria bacterium]MBK8720087.1 riboflavin synthase [Deltaproteobacteria bacterium]MBP7292260.1 riboflavin synthase [Nannocystaceae bacterium]
MFTGLVRTVGTVVAVTEVSSGRRLAIEAELPPADLELGASVCCAGVCLTVVASRPRHFEVEVAFESLRRTSIGRWQRGQRINLEPSLRVGDALGGHLVSGHVDAVASVRSVTARGDARELWIDLPRELAPLVAAKGSVCLDGTSLTVNDIDARGFMIGLVPHTLAVTTWGRTAVGDAINLEVDVLARYVARLLEARGDGVTMGLLRDAGLLADAGVRS